MTTLLCLNSHCSKSDHDIGGVKEALRQLGPLIESNTEVGADLRRRIRESREPVQRIVVGGGDGTINRMLPALLEAALPFGIIPMGTANDLARSLGLSLEPGEAAVPILAGATRTIRIAEVNGHPFVNAVGIGVGPSLTRNLHSERKKRLGVLAYPVTLFEVIRRIPHRVATVTIDGTRRRIPFMQITIANGIHYGGGMTIAEDARLDDGVLRVLCIEPQSPARLLIKAIYLRRGVSSDDEHESMSLFEGNEVSVSLSRPIDVTADGELVTKTPVLCKVHPVALEVYAPQDEERS